MNPDTHLVAVGMISEGTDIPRLQVCCHLSRIRTELHFRQVLGRVLRRTGEADDQAWLFMPAEPMLKGFSQRIADDLPEDLAVLRQIHIPTIEGFSPVIGDLVANRSLLNFAQGSSKQSTDDDVGLGLSLCEFDSSAGYHVSFSQHYRQQLMAVF